MADPALIGYSNLMAGATASPAGASVALIPNTFELYSAANGSFTYEAAGNFTGDYVAIGAHNLGDTGKTIVIGTSNATSGSFSTVYTGSSLTNNNAILAKFTSGSIRRIQITISGGSGNFSIGVVYCGAVLTMENSIYGGHSPATLSAETEFQNNASDSGQWLSRTIVRKGLKANFNFRHITPAFYRTSFQPFVKSARTAPFFVKWRPTGYPLETVMCWTQEDIRPSNMGVRDFMEVSFSADGYGDPQ
jgi:hypothetical protein